ncbi:MAG: septum formation initiator family protein [Acidimicrobiaceae bacterium]|nr:septum formation initiator family protein [Acidimicrobiaceae bacterium]
MIRRRRVVTIAIALVGITVYLLAVFPTRSYLLQRGQVKKTVAQVKLVENSNKTLQNQINSMNSPSVIENLARSQYGLVKPGEKAFVVLPPTSSTTSTTAAKKAGTK